MKKIMVLALAVLLSAGTLSSANAQEPKCKKECSKKCDPKCKDKCCKEECSKKCEDKKSCSKETAKA